MCFVKPKWLGKLVYHGAVGVYLVYGQETLGKHGYCLWIQMTLGKADRKSSPTEVWIRSK